MPSEPAIVDLRCYAAEELDIEQSSPFIKASATGPSSEPVRDVYMIFY